MSDFDLHQACLPLPNYNALLDKDIFGIVRRSATYQLVIWETVSVAVVISVRENPAVSSALGFIQGCHFGVVLPVERGLTRRLILKQLHLILYRQRGKSNKKNNKG